MYFLHTELNQLNKGYVYACYSLQVGASNNIAGSGNSLIAMTIAATSKTVCMALTYLDGLKG